MSRTRKVRSAERPRSSRSRSRSKRARSAGKARSGSSKYRIGKRLFNFKMGKTGAVVDNINSEHVMMKLNYPNQIVKVKKANADPQGRPCKKRCATCQCIPHETSDENMPHNSIPGQPPRPVTPIYENSNENDDYFNARKKRTKRNLMKQKHKNNIKIHYNYQTNHEVTQGKYKIKPANYPLYTMALVTCSALMMDIDSTKGTVHFLTHIDGGESTKQINEMISSIASHCASKPSDSISNIRVWAGAGSEKESGMYLDDPNQVSMPVVIKVLEGLDLIEIREGIIYYKGTDKEIPVSKTCFRHYVGK
jgi:hypothetical protein